MAAQPLDSSHAEDDQTAANWWFTRPVNDFGKRILEIHHDNSFSIVLCNQQLSEARSKTILPGMLWEVGGIISTFLDGKIWLLSSFNTSIAGLYLPVGSGALITTPLPTPQQDCPTQDTAQCSSPLSF